MPWPPRALALEEPENSLAPQFLGRIIGQLHRACDNNDVQSLIATHAPTMLRRVNPETIRFLRLNHDRETVVHRIVLPEDDCLAAKYVREAVEAFPELYFARLVVLGKGDSEQVVLPRVLAADGIVQDDASVAVVPLGGRHVNHFWRLLNELQIPHVTLLDLDCGRHQGGWGRVRNAFRQINIVRPGSYTTAFIEGLPRWDDDCDFPDLADPRFGGHQGPIVLLEDEGLFFSGPVDLDLMMMNTYPGAYGVTRTNPDEDTIAAVLGKGRANQQRLTPDVLSLFPDYHTKFDRGSKPATHLSALSGLSDFELSVLLPDVLDRMRIHVRKQLDRLPE